MAKDKYDFIQELLENKRLTTVQRERIFLLTKEEIKKDGILGRNFDERIKKLETVINGNGTDIIEDINNTNLDNLREVKRLTPPKYFDPYHLYKFLFEYNQNPVLRSTCHDADSDTIETINEYCESENYCFSKHLNKIIETYVEHEKNNAPPLVKALIRGYLTGKDYKGNELKEGWSTGKININWSSTQLTKWISKYKNIPPNINEVIAGDLEIELFQINPQLISPISYEPIQNFTQLVLHFKNLFHLKSGNQSLKSVLDRFNLLKKWHEKISFDISENFFSNNLEHFTDVDKLTQAYNKLLQLIVEQHFGDDKPKVKLSYYEENQNVYLSIQHLNGKYNKSIESTLTRPIGDKYEDLIKNQINGLCNLHLRADFGNGKYAEINLWDGEELKSKEIQPFEGVEHLLKFPKTKNS